MIINKDTKPQKTVYYLAAIINKILNDKPTNTTSLYYKLRAELKQDIDYQVFLLAVDFLFLIDKIVIDQRGDLVCF